MHLDVIALLEQSGRNMSVFKNVQGKLGENISTEILSYLISSEEYFVPFQRLFFNNVLCKPSSTFELEVVARTQVDLGEMGKPDLILVTGDAIVILENKLGSYLSGENQLLRYAEAFSKEKAIKKYFSLTHSAEASKHILLFLAPSKALEYSIAITERECGKQYGKKFKEFLQEKGIEFKKIAWETVIGWLDKADSLQNELFLYVEEFLNLELTKGERMVLQNPELPTSLLKLFKNIENIANDVSAKGWKISRMTQSYNFYGFYIETESFKLYFGYDLPKWEDFNTPVFLLTKESWFKTDKALTLSQLSENGFIHAKDHSFVLPFAIESISTWKKDLLELLAKLPE